MYEGYQILVSLDPIAIDQACLDLVYAATDDPGQKHFLERVESRHGVHTPAGSILVSEAESMKLVTLIGK